MIANCAVIINFDGQQLVFRVSLNYTIHWQVK